MLDVVDTPVVQVTTDDSGSTVIVGYPPSHNEALPVVAVIVNPHQPEGT